ncbi:MAG: nucleotidyltransferase domain-containing protein [Planctomycetes bacterium]|nr:nucleotidyltransferase domain-containing protein [Planctomycetota bacterium]
MADTPFDFSFGRPFAQVRATFDDHDARIYDALVDALSATYGARLRALKLVGSRARRDARPDSDHDLLVFLDHCDYDVEVPRLAALGARMTAAHGCSALSLSPMTVAQFVGLDAKYAGITEAFRRDAVHLWPE